MKIRHQIDAPKELEDVKEQLSNRWIPIVASVVATAIVVRFCTKAPQVNIYLNEKTVEL